MYWIFQNAGTIIACLVLAVLIGMALRNVMNNKNTCGCGSCGGNCCGCMKGKGREDEINRNKARTGRKNHCN